MPYASPLFLYKITTDFSKKQFDFLKKGMYIKHIV